MNYIRQFLFERISIIAGIDIEISENEIQKTNDNIEGDFTLLLSNILRNNNSIDIKKLVNKIGEKLKEEKIIDKWNVISVFFNMTLTDNFLINVFNNIICRKIFNFVKKKKNIVIEYSSPNTNKPLHLGHLRNNFLGYAMSKILEERFENVKTVCLINDRGIHICKSMVAYEKFGNGKIPEDMKIKGDHFVGNYYVEFDKIYKKECEKCEEVKKNGKIVETDILIEAEEMLKKWEDGDEKIRKLWKKMNEWVLDGFEETYKKIGVSFDKTYYESETYLLGKNIVMQGLRNRFFYNKEDGSVWVNLEDVGMGEKLLLRGNGTSVYITQDLGTINLRYEDFNFDEMVYVVGDEQKYHFEVLKNIVKKLGIKYADSIYHLAYGMVELPDGKMKSREGTVVDADDLIEEMIEKAKNKTEELGKISSIEEKERNELYEIIGLNALKFYLLKVDAKKKILFDKNKSIDFNGNTGPFILYTYVRIRSIMRNVSVENKEIIEDIKLKNVEKFLIITLVEYDDAIDKSIDKYNPSILAQYILKLAKDYNKFYEEIKIKNLKDEDRKIFDMNLTIKTGEILKKGMELLGMRTVEKM